MERLTDRELAGSAGAAVRFFDACLGEPAGAGAPGNSGASGRPDAPGEDAHSRGIAIHAACALGDESAVAQILEKSPALASVPLEGVSRRWNGAAPLAVLCAARQSGTDAERGGRDRLAIAHRLLAAGADPACDLPAWDLELGRRSALCAALGNRASLPLAELLVKAGAALDVECLPAVCRLSAGANALELLRFVLGLKPAQWQLAGAVARRLEVEDPATVELLLDAGADPSASGGWGANGSLLHHAVWQRRSTRVLALLLDRGASIDALDRDGRTPLVIAHGVGHAAAQKLLEHRGACVSELGEVDRWISAALAGDAQEARALRFSGSRIGTRSSARRSTPALRRGDHQWLSWCLQHARADSVPVLLALGLDPGVGDDWGRLPLHIAAAAGDLRSLDLLLAAGANPDDADGSGWTALERALTAEDADVRRASARRLIASGPAPAELRSYPTGDGPLDDELAAGGFVAAPGRSESFEAAADAIVAGDVERLGQLLSDDAALIRARSPRAHRAQLLHYIGANGIEPERQRTPQNADAVLACLLDAGPDVDAVCRTYGGGPANTTLGLVVSSKWPAEAGVQEALVRRLCAAGAAADGLDDEGSPLATAIAFRSPQAVVGLADYARLDNALFAAAGGDLEALRAMLGPAEAGPVLATGFARSTVPWLGMSADSRVALEQALACAARFGRSEVASWLAAFGVALDAASPGYAPPLHEAAFSGHHELALTLLELGADRSQSDPTYRATPSDWAREGGHVELSRILDTPRS